MFIEVVVIGLVKKGVMIGGVTTSRVRMIFSISRGDIDDLTWEAVVATCGWDSILPVGSPLSNYLVRASSISLGLSSLLCAFWATLIIFSTSS